MLGCGGEGRDKSEVPDVISEHSTNTENRKRECPDGECQN